LTTRQVFFKQGRLRPTWRAVFYTLAMILGSFALQIPLVFVLIALVLLGIIDQASLMDLAASQPLLVLGTLINLLLILPLTYLFRRFLDGDTVLSLGLARAAGWLRDMVAGLLLGTVLIGAIFAVEWAMGWLTVEGFRWQVQSPLLVVVNLLIYLLLMVAVAFYEELAYRGYILQNLNADWAVFVAVVASSLVFGLFHGLNPNVTWLALLNIFLAGVVLAACYLVTRSLWLPMAFHFSWNVVQGAIFSYPVSGLPAEGLLLTSTVGNPLLTGGAFGPEGGLLSTVALCLALLLLWACRRRVRAT
jgi:membrane protease YdiL (CAAX protease family)